MVPHSNCVQKRTEKTLIDIFIDLERRKKEKKRKKEREKDNWHHEKKSAILIQNCSIEKYSKYEKIHIKECTFVL